MTALLEGAKKLVARGSDLGARIEGLDAAADAARGRLDDAVVDQAREAADRASGRMRLSAEHTVVAIAGATGSGKSSTFNWLTGLDLSAVGVRRPTTSWATACVWGTEGATELLEWLGIPPRHHVTRDSMLDAKREDHSLDGVVMIDLPDHDSTELSHHLEVDRLVQLADLLVWVLDPQKYADAAIHDRYLAPYATHQDVMLVVLNHIDTVPESERDSMVADVRRLLDAEGLGEVPVLAVSAREGDGMPELKAEIMRRVSAKKSTKARIEADLKAAAQRLEEESGTAKPRALDRKRVAALEDAFADAAGVPTVVAAAEKLDQDPRPAGHRMAGDQGLLGVPARSPQEAQPRSGRGGQAPERASRDLGTGTDAGGTRSGRCRGARPGGRRLRGPDPTLGAVDPVGVGVPAAGPVRPARRCAVLHRPRGRQDPVVGRRGARTPVAADPGGAGWCGVAPHPGRPVLPPDVLARAAGRRVGARCRP